MDLRAVALLLAPSLTATLLVVRGRHVLDGAAGRAFLVLALTSVATLAAALVAARREARRRPAALPRAVEAVLGGAATALGDAAFAFDAAGRLVWANDAAVALAGCSRATLVGRPRDVLGPDLEVLLRGLGRGPAAGRVLLRCAGAPVEARAAAARVPGRAPVDVVVLRTLAGEPPEAVTEADLVNDVKPPPLPGAVRARASGGAAGEGEEAAALRAELAPPLARATAAAALLRMVLPAGRSPAAEHLARLERALHDAEATLAAASEPLGAPAPRRVDLASAIEEALAAARLPPTVKVERRCEPGAEALADAGQVRQALRHLLHAAALAMPAGGVLAVRTARRGAEVAIELADSGAPRAGAPGLDLSVARRLAAAQGGRLERAAVAGRGTLVRLVLPASAGAARTAAL